mmetsp:Transcript_36620/g.56823  ORF Transcript_36620/g.56823 Transcript_36620/m.56823 type:complete len:94 (-) Transcript_36620:143-424(-)|eukprot:CAMPEP_0177698980 /NCGR_PEP_ID=MMETSP0484_2-20121128/5339_1 /TAXON_ID=354590 /ORGANISM="Rhodomonas lens, Strain RHODO" /LENGTH=93 /DNA_ID=CAMNT_0019210127 /DNA_START=108 /DNA_END=389 /DNA_ORIENTATION=-
MWGDVMKVHSLFSVGKFDHSKGQVKLISLEMVDPLGSWNEGAWGMSPFNGEGVNNNAPMRVGTAPENYNTTGGYALYPGRLPACDDNHSAPCS